MYTFSEWWCFSDKKMRYELFGRNRTRRDHGKKGGWEYFPEGGGAFAALVGLFPRASGDV